MKNFALKIIYLNVIVALSAGLFTAGLCNLFEIENGLLYGVFSALATFSIYNLQRLYKVIDLSQTPWLKWVKQNQKLIFILSLASGIGAFWVLINVIQLWDKRAWLLIITSSIVSVFYVLKIGGKNIRSIPFLKIHAIAFTWLIVVCVFPHFVERGVLPSVSSIAFVYCFLIAVTIPFDIRDLKYDEDYHNTIPQLVGAWWAKIIALTLFCISVFFFWLSFGDDLMFAPILLAFATVLLLLALLNKEPSDMYCAGAIDGAIGIVGLGFLLC